MYRLQVEALIARVEGRVPLRGWTSNQSALQSLIYEGAFIVPTAPKANKLGIWMYPNGGKRTATWNFSQGNTLPGVAVSIGTQ